MCEIKNDFISKSIESSFLEKININIIVKNINLKYGILFLNEIKLSNEKKELNIKYK